MLRGLHAAPFEIGKPVDHAACALDDENRKFAIARGLRPGRAKPADRLARHRQVRLQFRHKVRDPWTCRHDDLRGHDLFARGDDADAGRRRLDPRRGLNDARLRAGTKGADRRFSQQDTAAVVHDDVPVIGQTERGKGRVGLPAVTWPDDGTVRCRRRRARLRHQLASRWTGFEDRARQQKGLPNVGFQRPPTGIGAVAQRGIGLALEIEAAKDPAGAVRRTPRFAQSQRIEAEHIAAAARQFVERGAAHETQTDDADVTALHRGLPCRSRADHRTSRPSFAL